MKTANKCQARNPSTCPHHGTPIHKYYKADVTDVEKFLRRKEAENKARQAQQGQHIPLKEMNANELAEELTQVSRNENWLLEEKLQKSIELAWILHSNQVRQSRGDFTNTPYIEHPLRNAVRLTRLGVKDENIIIAAVLHDTIEDGSQNYLKHVTGEEEKPEPVARETLANHIQHQFDNETLRLVKAVTNDYLADKDKTARTAEQKNLTYLKHVKNSITDDPKVLLVKISDFIDNAMSLHHHAPLHSFGTVRRAQKYLPVVDVFIEELNRTKLTIPAESQKQLLNNMLITKTRLQNIINHSK